VILSLPDASALSVYERIADTEVFALNKQSSAYYAEYYLPDITYFGKALSIYSPERMYETFAHSYKKGMQVYFNFDVKIDSRWLELFVGRQDIGNLVFMLNSDVRGKVLKYFQVISE